MRSSRIDRSRESLLSIAFKPLAAKGEGTWCSGGWGPNERQQHLARDSGPSDTAALLARLEAALGHGEAAAASLDALALQHQRLHAEARATVEALDRLIATGQAGG